MKVGDAPVEFRCTRDQARLLRDAARHYSKALSKIKRKRADVRSVEALRTSLLVGFLGDQIDLALKTKPEQRPRAAKKKR